MRLHLRIAGALLVLARIGHAAEGYSCEFRALPSWLVAGRTYTAELAYTTPPGSAPAALHCEVKAADGRYLSGQAATLSGTGTHPFAITAPAVDVARGVTLTGWFGEDWRQPFSAFARSPVLPVLSAARGQELDAMAAGAAATRKRLGAQRTAAGLIGVYRAPDTPWAGPFASALTQRLTQAGYGVVEIDGGGLSDPFVLVPDLFDALILCDARVTPAAARDAVPRFLQAGGKAFFLGGPAFEVATWQLDGAWLTTEAYRAALASQLPVHVLLDFESGTGGEWTRSSNRLQSPAAVVHVTPGAAAGHGCLHVTIADLTGWDTFRAPLPPQPFPAGHTWTVLQAKGDKATHELALEWTERDGSRWIAVAALGPDWQPIALPPGAFRYWHDSPAQGRGGPEDGFHPENAVQLNVGLALTHTSASGGGRHEFWLDRIGTAPAPEGAARDALTLAGGEPPRIEAVSPPYKLYEVTHLTRLQSSPAQVILPAPELKAAATLAPHPRPQGTGIHKQRRWRYVPLIDGLAADGRLCGQAAALVLNGAGPAAGGIVVSVPVTDPEFYSQAAVVQWVTDLVRRVDEGLFLYEGGAAFYASFGAETMPVGALVTNRGRQPQTAAVTARVADATGRLVWEKIWTVRVAPGHASRVEAPWPVPATAAGPFVVIVELSRDGSLLDRLAHEVRLWAPRASRSYLKAERGQFILDGKPWFAHGVNYMPASGIGMEDTEYFEYWLDPQPYDPDLIERDLADIQAMGLNFVSVFQYHRSMPSRNLLDLLARCEAHGLKVNLSLRPGTPMDFPWDKVREMIEQARLAENDVVVAYDLAWEPSWGNHDARRGYDRDWEAWVVRRHGSLAAAETAWGCPLPRAEGRLTNPADEQVSKDGPWRQMVLDYRRFLNELLHERYGRARELVRSVDPHHLVSFRMSIAGDPTVNPAAMPYDFAGLAEAVDLLEPEGYGRIGDWDHVKPGWFTTAYARCVAPELPVLWAEFGYSVWSGPRQAPDRLEFAAAFYDDFYRMAYESGANGTVCWWFPGGYRVNERSDFGIINPDRSWRPVTHVVRRWAARLTAPRPTPTPDVWFTVDVGQDVDGLSGLYRRLKDDFWKAADVGRRPGLRQVAPAVPP